MGTGDSLGLDSKAISALPVINKFIDRIELKKLLLNCIPSKQNQKLSHVDAILIFVRNILLEREPLYKLSEWAAGFGPCLVGLYDVDPEILSRSSQTCLSKTPINTSTPSLNNCQDNSF